MPGTYFGPYGEQYKTPVFQTHANLGQYPLGHTLILPDGREYKFTLNDATVEVAGNLYQSVAAVADHNNTTADAARAIGATAISSTLGATAAAVDIYTEGMVHINDEVGEGYSYRIKRAMTAGDAHASVATSSIITVNLDAGESVQVALTTASNVSYTRNRYHRALISAAPSTALLTGVSPGVAAADRYYWCQVKGYSAVLANLTLLAGLLVQKSIAVAGAVEMVKRRLQVVTTGSVLTAAFSLTGQIIDQDGNATGAAVGLSVSTATVFDISGGIANNAQPVGICVKANASTEFALIDLNIR